MAEPLVMNDRERMLNLIANEFGIEEEAIKDEDKLVNLGVNVDVIEVYELLCLVEDEYGISIPDVPFETLGDGTVGELIAYVEKSNGTRRKPK